MKSSLKESLVATYGDLFAKARVVVVARYDGLTVSDMEDLRRRMRDVGGGVKVVKNRLVKRALAGGASDSVVPLFRGPTVVAYSVDPVAAPKVASAFSEENANLVLLGGVMDHVLLAAADVENLARIPSLERLRAGLVGLIAAPGTGLVRLLSTPGSGMVRLLAAASERSVFGPVSSEAGAE